MRKSRKSSKMPLKIANIGQNKNHEKNIFFLPCAGGVKFLGPNSIKKKLYLEKITNFFFLNHDFFFIDETALQKKKNDITNRSKNPI
jgi:hypothetical protein